MTLQVPAAELGFTDREGRYAVEPGPYEAFVGDSSDTASAVPFTIAPD